MESTKQKTRFNRCFCNYFAMFSVFIFVFTIFIYILVTQIHKTLITCGQNIGIRDANHIIEEYE